MPQSKGRKREYMREYMRGYRKHHPLDNSVSPFRYNFPPQNVSPFVSPLEPFPWGIETTKSARHTAEYIGALNQSGYGLALTRRGYELVNLVTGELGTATATPATYQQQPTTRTLQDFDTLLLDLAQRITRLEVEQALAETPNLNNEEGVRLRQSAGLD